MLLSNLILVTEDVWGTILQAGNTGHYLRSVKGTSDRLAIRANTGQYMLT